MLAFASPAAAAAPPVQDITAFCAGGPAGDPFPDVPSGDTFHAEVACAKDAGLVNGKPDGLFHGLDTTSRAQMSSIVARADDTAVTLAIAGQTVNPLPAAGANPYQDVGDPPPNGGTPTAPHTNNILRLTTAGIVQGKSASTFDPAGSETRFQLIKTIVNSIEFVTGTTLDDTCGITFADGAENDPTFGEFVKKAGCAGIVQGKSSSAGINGAATNGNLGGGDNVDRYQTAAIGDRALAWLNANGFINALHGAASTGNQTYTADPNTDQIQLQGKSQHYVFSNLGTDTVNIALVNCSNVVVGPDGKVSFANSTNPGKAAGNNMAPGPVPASDIIANVNGGGTPSGGQLVLGATPSGGSIAFDVANSDNLTQPASCVIPVVYKTPASGTQLALDATNMPVAAQPFGIGGSTSFVPAPAQNAQPIQNPVFVQAVSPSAHAFVGCAAENRVPPFGSTSPASFTGPCFIYSYAQSNNDYAVTTGPSSVVTDQAAFEKELSPYDQVQINHCSTNLCVVFTQTYSTSGPNQFELINTDPAAPGGIAVQAGPTVVNPANPFNTVEVSFNDSGTPTTDSYNIYRSDLSGGRNTCPTFPNTVGTASNTTPYTKVGSVTDTSPGVNNSGVPQKYFFYDPNLTQNTNFCYVISSVDMTSELFSGSQLIFVGNGTFPSPVILSTTVTQSSTATAPSPTILDTGDTVQMSLANVNTGNPAKVASGATATFGDTYGATATWTNGVGGTVFSVSPGGNSVSILLGTPTATTSAAAASGSPTPGSVNTLVAGGIIATTGITSATGPLNLGASGLCGSALPTNTRQFEGNLAGTPNSSRIVDDNADINFGPCVFTANEPDQGLPSPFSGVITATAPNTVKIPAGDFNAATGDPIVITDANGNIISPAGLTYNGTLGNTVTTTQSFNNGDQLFVWYQDVANNCWGFGPGGCYATNLPSLTSPVTANAGTVTMTPTPIAANNSLSNSQTVPVTVTVKDQNNNVVPNQTVYLSLTTTSGAPGSATVNGTPLTATPKPFTTSSLGTITVQYTSSATATTQGGPQTDTIHAIASTPSGAVIGNPTDTYTYGIPTVSATQSQVTANPTSVPASSGASKSTITVTLLASDNTPIVGKSVSLEQSSSTGSICNGAGASCSNPGSGVFVQPAGTSTTNNAGQVTFQVFDPTAEPVTYTARDNTDGNTVLTHTATVTYTAGAATAAQSTVVANPVTQQDDNVRTSTVTVTLKDAVGNPVPGKNVTLQAITNGAGGKINGVSGIGPISGTATNASGQTTFTVSDNTAETVTYQAKDTSDGFTVTQTANVQYVDPTFTSATGQAASTQITVTFSDEVCRNAAFAGTDWTVTGSVQGAIVVNNDTAPACAGGVTSFILNLAAPVNSGQTVTVTLTATGAPKFDNAAGNSPVTQARTFNT